MLTRTSRARILSPAMVIACVVLGGAGPAASALHKTSVESRHTLVPARLGPRTLVHAEGPIVAFAQDGGRIAWTAAHHCVGRIHVETLKTDSRRLVGHIYPQMCASDRDPGYVAQTRLVLSGTRVLWSTYEAGNERYAYLYTAALPRPRQRSVAELSWSPDYGEGDHLGGLVGADGRLVYSQVTVGVQGPPGCDETFSCTTVIAGGSVRRLVRASSVRVPAAPPAVAMDISAGRMLLLPATVGGQVPKAGPNPVLEIRTVENGALLGHIHAAGEVRAVALGRKIAAALESSPNGMQIERFAVPGGASIGVASVSRSTAPELSVSGANLVFHVGTVIRMLNLSTGRLRTIARARSRPIGLSIDGSRVAWAENVLERGRLRGRIRQLEVRAAAPTGAERMPHMWGGVGSEAAMSEAKRFTRLHARANTRLRWASQPVLPPRRKRLAFAALAGWRSEVGSCSLLRNRPDDSSQSQRTSQGGTP